MTEKTASSGGIGAGIAAALAAPGGDDRSAVIPWGDSFKVNGARNTPVTLDQISGKDFVLLGTLEYVGEMGLDRDSYRDITEEMREEARCLDGVRIGRSDLASVPRSLRWFEVPYGRHTPAALMHDALITNTPDDGVLKNDAATDRYFRFMLQSVGVPLIKRWIMWSATAMRTRWVVRGVRRWSMIVWILLSVLGMAATVTALRAMLTDGGTPGDVNQGVLLGAALVAPFIASALWGKQWGAGVVAALTASWILPPTVIAALGYLVYWLLERTVRALSFD
jgi:hypothetical protein